MSKGKRYSTENQLNYQKVLAVVIAIAVVIMFIFIIKNSLQGNKEKDQENEYFALYTESKWGIINQKGEIIIQPSYQEMIIVPDKTKEVFICMYNINEETGEYKTKAINSANEEIYTDYEQIEVIENVDTNNNLWYEKNILRVKKNGKYGIININGQEIVPCEYEEIVALKGIENSLIVKKDGKVGLINSTGNTIIEPQYKEIKSLGKTYKEGYIAINEENKYGIISTTKKQLLENKYDEIEQKYLKDYYVVKEEGKRKLINTEGETIIEEGFDEIISKTEKGIIYKKGEQYGEITIEKEVTIEPKYQYLEEVQKGIYIAKQNDKYGIIDEQQQEKIEFKYEGITYNEKIQKYIAEDAEYNTTIIDEKFNEKITGILSEINTEKKYIKMRVGDENKYYNFKCEEKSNREILEGNKIYLSKKDGKYGYVDNKGNAVTEYIYDDATEQNEYGYSAVKKDGLWGVIGENGEEIIAPKYNLENNLQIDFIGKWHLGQDLNMNYYCDK